MAFSDDGGGFAFTCDDAKLSICASTWATRLSQIGKITGPIYIMTGLLPDVEFISKIIVKRPKDIFIIAHNNAHAEAKALKARFPAIRIVLHSNINAKVVLISPETVWISSSDFGYTPHIESAIGMHTKEVFNRTLESFFNRIWSQSTEVN